MPIMHLLAIFFTAMQLGFYFQIFPGLNMIIRLFTRAIRDISAFLVFYCYLILIFHYLFVVLGVRFHEGDQWVHPDKYDSEYDDHGEYFLIGENFVSAIALLRSSIGDLHPPDYKYWIERYHIDTERS